MTVSTRRFQPLFIFLSLLALLVALWAGLIRLGWHLPHFSPALPYTHGPLMVSGFLGTLISLERAVALQKRWMYLGSLFSGLGGVLLIFDPTSVLVPLLFSLGSLFLILIFFHILRLHRAIYTIVIAIGSFSWLAGNLLWLFSWPFHRFVLWWVAFLVLTIAGERLELNRVLSLPKIVINAFLAIIVLYLGGLLLSIPYFSLGTRLNSLGMIFLAFWCSAMILPCVRLTSKHYHATLQFV